MSRGPIGMIGPASQAPITPVGNVAAGSCR
ncbi:hypothetical protein J2853_008549 [Streptosporangium lutulentum]|uniref:Uncharacterized protein n=1 Tax=Streptosporangium lutulentum TaxID=1461250 RepID=A0ABT9QRG8_9ACTN|nr:hypothetical protein [Streptosporangium lutulentum]